MRKTVFLGCVALLALAACGSKRSGVFGHGGGPDEFAVSRSAPLTIPPDFALNPPKPGAPRPQEADSSTQALQAMFGGPAARSAAERGVLDKAGGPKADAGIRSQAGSPDTNVVDKGQTTRDIIAAPAGAGNEATVTTPQ